MGSSTQYRKYTIQVTLVGIILTLLGVTGYFMYANLTKAESHESQLLARKHIHSVIAVTCPCAPFFGFKDREEGELQMISTAFELIGQHAQYVYVSYEDAVSHIENHQVDAILAFNGMRSPRNGYYPSEPLVERNFVVVTLAGNQIVIENREDLAEARVGIHPEILKALDPQLTTTFKNPKSLQRISNNVLLATLLFTGEIDALITEESIFSNSLRSVPEGANASQQVKFYRFFDPIYPTILFEDKELRDRFNVAWKQVADAETDS